MGELFVEDKQIVIPGQTLANGMDYLPALGACRDGEKIRSSVIGVLGISGRVLRVIPLKSHYKPRYGDMVITKITDMTNSIWFADLDGFHDGVLTMREVPEYINDGDDLTQYYNFGDYILAKVTNVSRTNAGLTMKGPGLRKLSGGRIIPVNPAKVPRVIGKQGSMISLIKEKTMCRVIVGQNGTAWVQGAPEHEEVAVGAIELINENGHQQGLTEMIGEFIDKKMKDVVMEDSEEKPKESKKEFKTESKTESDEEEKATRRAVGKKKTVKRNKK